MIISTIDEDKILKHNKKLILIKKFYVQKKRQPAIKNAGWRSDRNLLESFKSYFSERYEDIPS